MIPIVVLALIVCALTVDYLVLRGPWLARSLATGAPGRSAIYVDHTHMWLAPEAAGLARVGVDAVASLLVGRPERIEWATHGRLTRGAPLAFVVVGGRRVTLRCPVDGDVIEMNPALTTCPSHVGSSPLDQGWLVRLRPTRLATQLRRMRTGEKLREWTREEMARLRALLLGRLPSGSLVGATALDGGALDANLSHHLDGESFAAAVRLVFADEVAAPSPSAAKEPGDEEKAS